MPLINEVKKICKKLAQHGWQELLSHHGLDITASDLENELLKELPKINRKIQGFRDFAEEGKRGIEPCYPARSLLFHAMASPNVIGEIGLANITKFPTLAEIDVIENFIYGVRPPSINDLNSKAREITRQLGDGSLAIAVFSSEYRPGPETVHRKHADMCFSRTGIARVGTGSPVYDEKLRGFLPFDMGDEYNIRVLPARYSPYIAVQLKGNGNLFGPLRFNSSDLKDETRNFWVPLHKLFDGPECIQNLNLTIELKAHHVNEKIKRIHVELRRRGVRDKVLENADLEEPPFKFQSGIAEFTKDNDLGNGLLIPVPHATLVEAAYYRGKRLSLLVPPESKLFESSFYIPDSDDDRQAPEFVHVRHKILHNGSIVDLNDKPHITKEILKGNYRAQHYLDFTADGWIEVSCPQLATELPRPPIPAYSLVTAPDFFPNCDQGEIFEWWKAKVPKALREKIWYQGEPYALSDSRLPPNLELQDEGANFRPEDDSVTAIVSLPTRGPEKTMSMDVPETSRHTYLPDGASGEFAPGWDVSKDRTKNIEHLAAYGLGSPFPEDSKLCAALSAYWPAAAPDAGRTFYPVYPTVCPLTDDEIGEIGTRSWDGFIGPKTVTIGKNTFVEYIRNKYVDYVQNSLQNKFTLARTGLINTKKFKSRILAMARAYQASGILKTPLGDNRDRPKFDWPVLSFLEISGGHPELKEAEKQTGHKLSGDVYRIEIYHAGNAKPHPDDFRKILVSFHETITMLVGSASEVLIRRDVGDWKSVEIH